jgi:phenylalanyl-tRNA synthetase beta chain
MNIKVTNTWLKDYVETDALPNDIARLLSLHSFSVERYEKAANGDTVYEIEVTPNRGDALSVLGIARELKVVLPRNKFTAKWVAKDLPSREAKQNDLKLNVEIKNSTLVPRFSAIIMDNVAIKASPDYVKQRLENVGIRALSNVIDVTNYMMIDRGQPMHIFDYDKIKGHKMIVRESKEGEKIVTLDGVERTLPRGVIVIEDGEKNLIDLCGIMGGKNSEVDENTKRIVLFVQIYDPVRIRRASMTLGHRTEAALRFEKGIDYEGVLSALWEAVDLIKVFSGANTASHLIDMVNEKRKPKEVEIDYKKINLIAGVELSKDIVDKTLKDLGFDIQGTNAIIPSWRYDDIGAIEDLAEEVIRIYGYQNLPNRLLEGPIPVTKPDISFYWEDLAKDYLKYMGFFECYSYSATDKNKAGENAVKLSNPLTEDFAYLRTSLVPQLIEILDKNQSYDERIKLFELATTYYPKQDDLPDQCLKLGMIAKGVSYLEFKGLVEALFDYMGIKSFPDLNILQMKEKVFAVELDFEALVRSATKDKVYTPLTSFNSIKEDLTFIVPEGVTYQQIAGAVTGLDSRITKLEFKDIYQNNLTFAIEYLDRIKQISSEDTRAIREKIFDKLHNELNVELKR